jgi:hypothetical protein
MQEVSVHNLDICYGTFGIAWCQWRIFFFHVEKNAFIVVQTCWSNTLKMIKTIELLALPFFGAGDNYFREKLLYISVKS